MNIFEEYFKLLRMPDKYGINMSSIPKLYHYTSVKALKSILSSQDLFLTYLRDFDDESEGRIVGELLESYNPNAPRVSDLKYFVFSMCEHQDDFQHWMVYGDKQTGVSIEFSFDQSSISQRNCAICKIVYDSNIQKEIIHYLLERGEKIKKDVNNFLKLENTLSSSTLLGVTLASYLTKTPSIMALSSPLVMNVGVGGLIATFLYDVYQKHKKAETGHVIEILKKIIQADDIDSFIDSTPQYLSKAIIPFFKSQRYASEEEIRLVYAMTDKNNVIPIYRRSNRQGEDCSYVSLRDILNISPEDRTYRLPISNITIGPDCTLSNYRAIQKLVNDLNLPIKVTTCHLY